jgi:hypothetical protein
VAVAYPAWYVLYIHSSQSAKGGTLWSYPRNMTLTTPEILALEEGKRRRKEEKGAI